MTQKPSTSRIAILAALAGGGAAIFAIFLLINIFERKQEAKNPFFRVVELTDENYKVLRSVANTANYSFPRLKPGRYRVRLIVDRNGNGRRDAGNIQKLMQPEDLIYHPGITKGIVPLKANFELTDIDF